MTFAARLTRSPLPFDPDAGCDAAAAFADQPPEVVALIAGTAGCSPYLKGLMAREDDWLRAALAIGPEAAAAGVFDALPDVALPDLPVALRQAKRRIALIAALADLGGVWPLETVTETLTRLADLAVDLSMKRLVAEEIRRGKLPGQTPEDAEIAAGMVALAMGKMGAGELNYSSDIDLICLFDETRYPGTDAQEARAAFIRVTRKMTAIISDITSEGYVFRLDLRLRPDASVTPVCLSMAAAESYYESVGRTWERAAYIKARPCGGDLAAGARFLDALTPFVWRRHLDFAAIQDAHDMRLRIRDHKGLSGPVVLEGHNMKLGIGGIREIEFFTQTRQLIAGGRDPDLRDRTTVGGLTALAAKGWVPENTARDLIDLYRHHREVEHRLQMVQDAQTQLMPATPDGIDRIARFCGQADGARFRTALRARIDRVAELTESFFAPAEAEDTPDLTPAMAETVESWRNLPALRSSRAQGIFRRLRPQILKRLMRATNPAEALAAFDRFLAGLPAGVQLFSLFDSNPTLIDLIVDICGTAPALAQHLSRNSGVLDAVLGGSFFSEWPTTATLVEDLTRVLSDPPDYERKLDAARRWRNEWHFRIGVHHLRGLIDAFEAGKEYADLAEAVIAALVPVVRDEFARKHGPPPGLGAMVLGMGSIGAGRLNAGSDLDLIVIYDDAGVEASDGPRPLATRPYYARFTQALVTALTAQMPQGRLYEVDMRLRPSGRAGPVATSITAFTQYQELEAWTWEHLALTRARPLAGPPELCARVEQARQAILRLKSANPAILADVAQMRARLLAHKPGDGTWEAKNGPGRIMDIELLAQTGALLAADPARRVEAQLRAALKGGLIDKPSHDALASCYRLLWRVQAPARLLESDPPDPDGMAEGARAFILRETGEPEARALADRLMSLCAASRAIIDAKFPQTTEDVA
jgi:glutamate-ammonia-ligase adenylyltransferase